MTRHSPAYIALAVLIVAASAAGGASQPQPPSKALKGLYSVFEGVAAAGVIYSNPALEKELSELDKEAKELGVSLVKVRVESIKDVPESIRNLVKNIDTLIIYEDPCIDIPDAFNYIMVTALQNRCKTIVPREELLSKGGLFYMNKDGKMIINQRIMTFMKLSLKEDPPKYVIHGEGK